MKKSSKRRSQGKLERLLLWVLVALIFLNLLLFLPRMVPYIRLDLIHPSLPVISLDALRLDNLPLIRDLVRGVKNRTSAHVSMQNPTMVDASVMMTLTLSPLQPTSSPINDSTATLISTQPSTITANPTSTQVSEPTSTPTPVLPSPTSTSIPIKMYYVAPNGDDSNPGTIDDPWRTLAPIHARDFLLGDVIHFERGGSWSGGLVINDSGVEDKPITFTAYGTGKRPVFTNPGGAGSLTRAVKINADWVVVEGFLVQESHEAGVYISNGSDYKIVRDIEATNAGIGIAMHGQHNLATRNYVHDLHMVVNTIGGDDDYGATGIWMFNSNNEVSYNRMVNCKAPSYDYGIAGGALEWYGAADNNYAHHNRSVFSEKRFKF